MKHVVAGVISQAIDNGQDRYLLVKSKRDFGEFSGFWYPPGGHLEESEDEEAALIREIKEELGITVKPIQKIAETPGDVKDQITHWWKCKAKTVGLNINDKEIADAGWFTGEETEEMKIWPATKKFFDQYIF